MWTDWAIRYGYFGAFISAFIGSITFVLVFPYTIIVFFLATQGLSPLWLGILMGTGAALGQMSGYLFGLLGARPFQRARPREYDALERIVHFRPKFVQWLLFFFAVTPLPDDVLFIPLGMLRYKWWKTFLPTWAGKVISGLLVTYSSKVLSHVFDTTTAAPVSVVANQLVTFFTVAIVLYFIFKLDWDKMMHRLLDPYAPKKPVGQTETES